MFRTKRNLPLGEWSVIENFKVSAVGKGKFRPTSHQYKMTITNETVFGNSDHKDDSPFLSLASYERISNGSEDSNILIGMFICSVSYIIRAMYIFYSSTHVIKLFYCINFRHAWPSIWHFWCPNCSSAWWGSKENSVSYERHQVLLLLMFKLCVLIWFNISRFVLFLFGSGNNLACCFWGSYAEKIENFKEESLGSTTVWLLRFAKIGEFRGNILFIFYFVLLNSWIWPSIYLY